MWPDWNDPDQRRRWIAEAIVLPIFLGTLFVAIHFIYAVAVAP